MLTLPSFSIFWVPWLPGRVAFGRSLPSFGRPGSAREPWRDSVGWMDGGRLAGFGGGGFFSTKNEDIDFLKIKQKMLNEILVLVSGYVVFHICDSFFC